jgi:hypothetical protein
MSDSRGDFASRLKKFDAYPKTIEDFRVRTFSGATRKRPCVCLRSISRVTTSLRAVSIVSAIFMFFLFVSEFRYFLQTEIHPELSVDTTRGEMLQINVDIVFPRMPCVCKFELVARCVVVSFCFSVNAFDAHGMLAVVTVDAMDVAGQTQVDIEHNMLKERLDRNGKPMASSAEKEHCK